MPDRPVRPTTAALAAAFTFALALVLSTQAARADDCCPTATAQAPAYFATPQASPQACPQSCCPYPQGYCPFPQGNCAMPSYCDYCVKPLGTPEPFTPRPLGMPCGSPQASPQGWPTPAPQSFPAAPSKAS